MGEYNWKYSIVEQWKVYQYGWETDEDKLSQSAICWILNPYESFPKNFGFFSEMI